MAMSNITVAGITPDLSILGNYQRVIFPDSDPVVKFQAYGEFIPVSLTDSVINIESRNNQLSGFRWKHTSKSTDTNNFGSFKFQSFVSDGVGTDIWGFDGTNINFYNTVYRKSAAGLLSWGSNATNTPVTANTFTKALGTTALSSAANCATMPSNNRLTFVPASGTQTISALIRASVTFQWAAAGTPLLGVSIYKNGVQLLPAAFVTGIAAANLYTLSIENLASLTNSDYVEIWVSSSTTNATGITVVHGTLSFVSV